MRNQLVRVAARLGAVTVLLCCAVSSHAQQTTAAYSNSIVPPLVNFSGVLTDASGKPPAETAEVTFSLYSEQQGGAPLWTETQAIQPDATGHYSVLLGAATASGLPSSLFVTGVAHWLGVQAQGQQEQSRVLLVSAPYALKAGDAETVGGLPPSAFLLAAPGTSSAGGGPSTSVPGPLSSPADAAGKPTKPPLSGSGITDFVPIWTGSTVLGDSMLFQVGGDVGVGTSTPAFTLDAMGSINTTAAFKIGGLTVLAAPQSDTTSIAVGYQALMRDNIPSGGNTATGVGALSSNTTGTGNTASGYQALDRNSTGGSNTASGYEALHANTIGSNNTASGLQTLDRNTTGSGNTASGHLTLNFNSTGSNNTANSAGALYGNTTASDNTASGHRSLVSNTTGSDNTANGFHALYANIASSGSTAQGYEALTSNVAGGNTASGFEALFGNTTATGNTAIGMEALRSNTHGGNNTASGYQALVSNTTGKDNTASGGSGLGKNTTGAENTASGEAAMGSYRDGSQNTAIGTSALGSASSGDGNIAIGYEAGLNVSSGGSNNIHMGSLGASGDSGTIRIGSSGTQTSFFAAGVGGVTTGLTNAVPVMIDSNGQLGTISSSRRFKEDIQDMGEASRGLMLLRPVAFRYQKPYADGSKPIQYGLIAEEVAQVYPDLVARSADGQIETVKYQVLDPMLLNEVQRQQAEIQGLQVRLKQSQVPRQEAEIRELEEGLDKLEAALASNSCRTAGP